MNQNAQYNLILDEVIEKLKLIKSGGVDYVDLGPKRCLDILFASLKGCALCPLHKERLSTSKINLGRGGLRAELAFVLDSELSMESEERELLEKMTAAMGVGFEDIYITNTIKCVTKESNKENEEALEACKDFLLREIEYVSPTVVITMGENATKALFTSPLPFSSIKGRFQNPATHKNKRDSAVFNIMPTHPLEQLIGNKDKKKESWSDLRKVMARLGLKPAR